MNAKDWYVYLLECRDTTFYCGIAKNVERRLAEHNTGKGARYTRGRGPVRLVWQTAQPLTRSEALKLELHIKEMTREQKKGLIFQQRDSSSSHQRDAIQNHINSKQDV